MTYREGKGIITRDRDGAYRAYLRGRMTGGPAVFGAWLGSVGTYRTLYGARMALRRARGPATGVVLAS